MPSDATYNIVYRYRSGTGTGTVPVPVPPDDELEEAAGDGGESTRAK